MALTKADIAQKIADDCGFMKGEAAEVLEKLAGYNQDEPHRWRRRDDLRLRKMERQIEARQTGQES